MACERKKSGGNVNTADNQNAHSMFFAVRAIVRLYEKVGRSYNDLDGKVLAFSISHNSREIRIHAYYPVIQQINDKENENKKNEQIVYHRHEIDNYILRDHSRWRAFRFVATVYEKWAPVHLAEIPQVIDEIPVYQAAEARRKKLEEQSTGLTQQMKVSSMATDLDDLVPETVPENFALGSSDTSISIPNGQIAAKVSISNDRSGSSKSTNRKISKHKGRKD